MRKETRQSRKAVLGCPSPILGPSCVARCEVPASTLSAGPPAPEGPYCERGFLVGLSADWHGRLLIAGLLSVSGPAFYGPRFFQAVGSFMLGLLCIWFWSSDVLRPSQTPCFFGTDPRPPPASSCCSSAVVPCSSVVFQLFIAPFGCTGSTAQGAA